MKKINWKPVKDIAELICGFAAYGLLVAASNKLADHATEGYISKIGYDEAVKAIMDSSMYSHEKCEAVSVLKRKGDSEFYRAIVHVAKDSRLYSHDKLDLIKDLCQN